MDLKEEIIQRVVKERLGEPNGIYKRHIHQDLVKEMMEQYHQSLVNNGVLDDVINCCNDAENIYKNYNTGCIFCIECGKEFNK